jgi:hypothetical protein
MPIELAGVPRRPLSTAGAVRLAQTLLCVSMAVYGIGTAAALLGPTRLPHDLSAAAVRLDASAWPQFSAEFQPASGSELFAVDYSVAGQVSHYSGRPVYSSHGQYRLWGVPDFQNLIVLSTVFIPPELITDRLRRDFEAVSGPEVWRYDEDGLSKSVIIWRATGRRAPVDQLLEDLDYLNLARQAAIALH